MLPRMLYDLICFERLREIPGIGPIWAALLVAIRQTPPRFRTKRQLWAYSGLAIETHGTGEYHACTMVLRYIDESSFVHQCPRK